MSDGLSVPPGWYDDGSGESRWWTGAEWANPDELPPPTEVSEAVPSEVDARLITSPGQFWLPVVALAVVVIVLAGVGLVLFHPGGSRATATPSSSIAPSGPTLAPARADAIGKALSTGDTASIAVYLAPVVRAAYLTTPSRLWPVGSTATVEVNGFKTRTSSLATVPVVVTGTQPGNFTLLLILSDGQWDVLATARVG